MSNKCNVSRMERSEKLWENPDVTIRKANKGGGVLLS